MVENRDRVGVVVGMLHFLQSGPSRCSGKTPVNLRSREAAFSCWMRTGAACSVAQLCLTSLTVALQASLSITNSWSSFKLMSIESVMPSNHLILCHPLSSCLQSFPASGSFPRVGSLHQVAKVLELQLQHQSSQRVFSVDFL